MLVGCFNCTRPMVLDCHPSGALQQWSRKLRAVVPETREGGPAFPSCEFNGRAFADVTALQPAELAGEVVVVDEKCCFEVEPEAANVEVCTAYDGQFAIDGCGFGVE